MADGHFHLLCRMHLGKDYTDEEIRQRYKTFFEGEEDGKDRELTDDQVERFRYRTRYFIDSGSIGSREFVAPSASYGISWVSMNCCSNSNSF